MNASTLRSLAAAAAMAWRHPPQLKSVPPLFSLPILLPLQLTPTDSSPSRPVDRRLPPQKEKRGLPSSTQPHQHMASIQPKKKKSTPSCRKGPDWSGPNRPRDQGDQPHPLIGRLGVEPPGLSPFPHLHHHSLLAHRYRCFLNVSVFLNNHRFWVDPSLPSPPTCQSACSLAPRPFPICCWEFWNWNSVRLRRVTNPIKPRHGRKESTSLFCVCFHVSGINPRIQRQIRNTCLPSEKQSTARPDPARLGPALLDSLFMLLLLLLLLQDPTLPTCHALILSRQTVSMTQGNGTEREKPTREQGEKNLPFDPINLSTLEPFSIHSLTHSSPSLQVASRPSTLHICTLNLESGP